MSTPPKGDAPPLGNLYDIDASDPDSTFFDRSALHPEDIARIGELMAALSALRDAEKQLSDASLRYMKLNQTDMRALHYLIVASHRDVVVTPGALTAHLGISSASTTKMLDRLERGGHIVRHPHPTDRRALALSITPDTHRAAMETVGRQQAKRFHAAARLTPAERETVIRFIRDMTDEISLTDETWAHGSAPGEPAPR